MAAAERPPYSESPMWRDLLQFMYNEVVEAVLFQRTVLKPRKSESVFS